MTTAVMDMPSPSISQAALRPEPTAFSAGSPSVWLQAMEAAWFALPAEVAAEPARQAAWQRFLALGQPTRKLECYKYEDLRSFWQTAFSINAQPEVILPERQASLLAPLKIFSAADEPIRLVAVNNQWLQIETLLPDGLSLEIIDSAPVVLDETDALSSLGACLTQKTLRLKLEAGVTIAQPIEVLLFSTAAQAPEAQFAAFEVILGDNAQAQLVFQQVSLLSELPLWRQTQVNLNLASNAVLNWTHIIKEAPSNYAFGFVQANLASHAQLLALTVGCDGKLIRQATQVNLNGEGADAQLKGLSVVGGTTSLHHHVNLQHRVPNCSSSQTFKTILEAQSRAEFDGTIEVFKDAQHTDAQQLSKSLLLSDKAKTFARPWLKIDADDVKCSHGATVGQLNEAELFYLTSRGIGPEAAKCLLTYSFALEVLQSVTQTALHSFLERRVLDRLGLSQTPTGCFTTCSK